MFSMDGRVENSEERVGDDEAERRDNEDERKFKVDELVEFWDGALVRGYRTDSGAQAYMGKGILWGSRVWDKNG